jgi:hypothetical protein
LTLTDPQGCHRLSFERLALQFAIYNANCFATHELTPESVSEVVLWLHQLFGKLRFARKISLSLRGLPYRPLIDLKGVARKNTTQSR